MFIWRVNIGFSTIVFTLECKPVSIQLDVIRILLISTNKKNEINKISRRFRHIQLTNKPQLCLTINLGTLNQMSSEFFLMPTIKKKGNQKISRRRKTTCHIKFTNKPQVCLKYHKQKGFIKNIEVKLTKRKKTTRGSLEAKMVTM